MKAANNTPRRSWLRREIIAVLCFKLFALIALRYLFFDDRPVITPSSVEQRMLDHSEPVRTHHD